MKKVLIVFAVICVLMFAFAVHADQTIVVLHSGATGTTAAVNGTVQYMPFTVSTAGCDIQSSPTVTVTVLFKAGNAYRNVATFDAAGLAAATTCTTGACNVQFTKTFLAMQAVVTAETTTALVNVNCAVK